MKAVLCSLLASMLSGVVAPAVADHVDFSDYRMLKRGMSEAQVVSRIGEPDRETVIDNALPYKKIWYYLPDGGYSWQFITIITIDANGRVSRIERERP